MNDWTAAQQAIEAGLSDQRVSDAVREFIDGCGGALDYDGLQVRFSKDAPFYIEPKALVIDRREGAFLSARVALEPILEAGQFTGLTRGGTIRFRFSLAGEYLDEVYSRDSVV
jgi:hypothetical protein